ncbi:MAG TPA: FAD:protein FMN transferase [Gaiellaceae bacterium]
MSDTAFDAATFTAIGTTATVAATRIDALPEARRLLAVRLDRLDRLCSRFRADSELSQANVSSGSPRPATPELRAVVADALSAAAETGGLVDPTVGRALRDAGYDRTFTRVRMRDGWTFRPGAPTASRWLEVVVDDDRGTLTIPAGVQLDLGATAKAREADDAARELAAVLDCGVLVSLGGDVAVSGGPPRGGWCVRIADDHAAPHDVAGPLVALEVGGLATSGTAVRRWPTADGEAHHLIDPRTGRPAATPWRTVSVAGPSCLAANIAATAAIVLGEGAIEWLCRRGVHARLVARDGGIRYAGGWPRTAEAA